MAESTYESNKTQVETEIFDFISKSFSDRMKYNTLQRKYTQNREKASIQHVGGKPVHPSEAKHYNVTSKTKYVSHIYNNLR